MQRRPARDSPATLLQMTAAVHMHGIVGHDFVAACCGWTTRQRRAFGLAFRITVSRWRRRAVTGPLCPDPCPVRLRVTDVVTAHIGPCIRILASFCVDHFVTFAGEARNDPTGHVGEPPGRTSRPCTDLNGSLQMCNVCAAACQAGPASRAWSSSGCTDLQTRGSLPSVLHV